MNDFKFEKFVEEWAMIYKPMQHNRQNNVRFFVTDSYYSLVPLIQGTQSLHSPIVMIESSMDGVVDGKFDHPTYAVYMLSQSKDMRDGYSAIIAKREAKQCLFNLLNLMRAFQDGSDMLAYIPFPEGGYMQELYAKIQAGTPVLTALNLDVSYQTVGEMFDGWQGVYTTIDDTVAYDRCIEPSMYNL